MEVEGRQTALEEDVKIALVDLHKRIAAEEIHLPSSRFTTEELLRGLKVIKSTLKNEVDMNQTIKGMILGTAMTVASLLLISSVSHAEWFNSRAPLSDSSTLKRIAVALEQIAVNTEKISELQEQLLELKNNED